MATEIYEQLYLTHPHPSNLVSFWVQRVNNHGYHPQRIAPFAAVHRQAKSRIYQERRTRRYTVKLYLVRSIHPARISRRSLSSPAISIFVFCDPPCHIGECRDPRRNFRSSRSSVYPSSLFLSYCLCCLPFCPNGSNAGFKSGSVLGSKLWIIWRRVWLRRWLRR